MDRYEYDVEEYLIGRTEELDGVCLKFRTPGRRNAQDRILMFGPPPVIIFVELKRPNGVVRPGQIRWRDRMRAMGFNAEILKSSNEVDAMFRRFGIVRRQRGWP